MLGMELPVENILQQKFMVPDPNKIIPTDMPFSIYAAIIDKTIVHPVEGCSNCDKDLRDYPVLEYIRRQLYDIPILRMLVTEHQAEVKQCSCGCLNKAPMPDEVSHYVQYGPNIKTLMIYLQDYQLLPYKRSSQLVDDLFEHKISQGTLYNFRQTAFESLEEFEVDLELFLCAATLAGFDETGLRVMAQLFWLHSCSTDACVHYQVHKKRGRAAMDDIGILPEFKGIAVHDFWKSYYQYECEHALCNAHILRELIFIKERFEQDWAQELIDLLLKMKTAKQKARQQSKSGLSASTLNKYRKAYDKIIAKGLKQNPLANAPPENQPKKRGRKAKSKPRKISGCFRSLNGAQYFTRIRSFIVTARKQGVNAFEAIRSLFTDKAMPKELIRNLYC